MKGNNKFQQDATTNKMKGRLAEVSIYEFVNDWIRPEISWQIMSYAVEDPHKESRPKQQRAPSIPHHNYQDANTQLRRQVHTRWVSWQIEYYWLKGTEAQERFKCWNEQGWRQNLHHNNSIVANLYSIKIIQGGDWLITNKAIGELLKGAKVPGRTKLMKGIKKHTGQDGEGRIAIIKALMKV